MTAAKPFPDKSIEKTSCRMNAEDRRQQILDVAVQLFSQKGFRGTTTKEIASAAGVNEAIIFRHFATKSDLYAAIIDCKAQQGGMDEMIKAIEEAMKARDDRKVFELFALKVLNFHAADATPLRVLFYSVLEGNELSRMIFRNHILQAHQQLSNYIKSRIKEGAFQKVDAATAVRGFMGMVMGQAIHERFFGEEARDFLQITNRQAAERFTSIFLQGITKTVPKP